MQELEISVNHPFKASLIAHLYADQKDLKLASPNSTFPFCEKEWEEHFSKNPENCSLLFKLHGKIIGHISILPNGEDIYLCYVILLAEFRGQKLAPGMIRGAEEFARLNYPHDEILLNVTKTNLKAIRLYEMLGYERVREEEDRYKMRKKLRHLIPSR